MNEIINIPLKMAGIFSGKKAVSMLVYKIYHIEAEVIKAHGEYNNR
ncbi:hypothetical protein [Chryseobacterium contaminans]|nr:hypothetical protein [Chryseobacterium contaminans]